MNLATVERFTRTCGRHSIPAPQRDVAWESLIERYREPHRHYHTLDHVDRMLGHLDATGSRDDSIELAIWFHDIVYEPGQPDNEARSAALFSQLLKDCGDDIKNTVSRLILATAKPWTRSGRADEGLLLDIDLIILGAPSDDDQRYCAAIRKEFAFVSDEDFKRGRTSLLQMILAQPIYGTDHFDGLDARARSNIEAELRRLNP